MQDLWLHADGNESYGLLCVDSVQSCSRITPTCHRYPEGNDQY